MAFRSRLHPKPHSACGVGSCGRPFNVLGDAVDEGGLDFVLGGRCGVDAYAAACGKNYAQQDEDCFQKLVQGWFSALKAIAQLEPVASAILQDQVLDILQPPGIGITFVEQVVDAG